MPPANPSPQMQKCALRALTLCDGHLLEQPDHALTTCLCWLQERAEMAGYMSMARGAARDRSALTRLTDNDRESVDDVVQLQR